MNLPLKIAFRYFKGKKSAQAINIVTWISISAIALSAMAMIVLFSVYNGLEDYVKSMYTSFYPQVKIEAKKGKFFSLESAQLTAIKKLKGVQALSFSVEDMALLDGVDHQKVITLKGVDNEWFKVNDMEAHINTGTAFWPEDSVGIPSNIGVDIIAEMGIDVSNPYNKISIYYPRADATFSGLNAADALKSLDVSAYASFNVQPELDGKFFLVPLEAAQRLFESGKKWSAVEISLKKGANESQVIDNVARIVGKDLAVMSRMEQNKTLYMVTKAEKWAIYGILLLVLVISSFNMVGSLSMLAIDKKLDIAILKSLGTTQKSIRAIFLHAGLILSSVGALAGLFLGLVLILSQRKFGLISMGDGFMASYPVALNLSDFLLVLVTVLSVGLLAALYPASRAARQEMIFRED